jgi:3-oxoacyl-(acyl-carrier-protein) synthase
VDVAFFPGAHPGHGSAVTMPGGVRYAMSNSFGFGGTNSSLVFGKWGA